MNVSDTKPRNVLWPVVGLLVLASLARVIPHTANVTPFFAVAMAAGAWMGRDHVKLTSLMAIGAMVVSDLVLGFHWTMPFVYAGLAVGILVGAVANGSLVKTENLALRTLKAFGFAGTGSAGFFIVSNVGVWVVGGLYPMTVDGLISCFVMAVPFFMKSLASDLFFGSLFLMVVAHFSARRVVHLQAGALNAR